MVTVSTVSAPDRSAAARFLARFPGETRDEAFWDRRFRLWWDLNPACAEGAERGWVIRDGGEVVGFLGDVPSLFRVGERTLTIHNGTTWRVAPDHRGYGMKLWHRIRRASPDSIVVVTAVSAMTQQVLRAAGISLLPKGPDVRYLRVFGDAGVVASSLLKVGLLPESSTALDCQGAVLHGEPDLAVKRLPVADDRFDSLWQATAGHYDCTNVRTADVVNWYCFAGDRFRKTLLGCYQGSTLVGYLVGAVETRQAIRVWAVLDVWHAPAANEVLAALAAAAIQETQASGCDVLQFPILKPAQVESLRRLGCVPYRDTRRTDYCWTGPQFPGHLDEADSYLTDAQGDRGL